MGLNIYSSIGVACWGVWKEKLLTFVFLQLSWATFEPSSADFSLHLYGAEIVPVHQIRSILSFHHNKMVTEPTSRFFSAASCACDPSTSGSVDCTAEQSRAAQNLSQEFQISCLGECSWLPAPVAASPDLTTNWFFPQPAPSRWWACWGHQWRSILAGLGLPLMGDLTHRLPITLAEILSELCWGSSYPIPHPSPLFIWISGLSWHLLLRGPQWMQ